MTRKMKLAYLAGLFDGEGCIGLYNTRTKLDKRAAYYQLVMRVTQKTPFGIKLLNDMWAGNLAVSTGNSAGRVGPYFSWKLTNKKAELALTELLPYLHEKKSQAELALSFCLLRRKQNVVSKREQRRLNEDELAVRDVYIAKIKGEKHRVFSPEVIKSIQ